MMAKNGKRNSLAIGAALLLFGMGPAGAVSLGSVTLMQVSPRIFTPNGDQSNDKARFLLDNPELLPVSGTVYDLSGARVANLTPGAQDPLGILVWDGKDDGGRPVNGGIYIYQIEFQGKHATGTVVVAR